MVTFLTFIHCEMIMTMLVMTTGIFEGSDSLAVNETNQGVTISFFRCFKCPASLSTLFCRGTVVHQGTEENWGFQGSRSVFSESEEAMSILSSEIMSK